MPILYENYITGDDHVGNVYGANWDSQTFTPSLNHTVTSVKLKLQRVLSPGTLTVSIRATSSSLPTGSDLASGATNGNTLTTDAAGEWREITLGAGTLLLASTEYAICVRALSGDGSNMVNWRRDDTSPTYAGGQRAFSSNSGTDWTALSTDDFMFEEWGDGTGPPVVSTQAVTSIASTTATGNGNVTDLGDSNVTEHGHCWNTGGLPTTSDSKTTNGSKATTGTFTSSLTSLTSGTLYYVRAYATNTDGTTYGDEVSFTAGAVGGELRGLYAVVEERFHYVDAYGVERFIQGTVVT